MANQIHIIIKLEFKLGLNIIKLNWKVYTIIFLMFMYILYELDVFRYWTLLGYTVSTH